jgi:magnesium transporter
MAFGPDKVIEKDIEDVQTVRSFVGQWPVTWINVAGLGDLSVITNRTNEIMKFLTIFTAVFFPMTLIAGIYGMNFNTRVSPWNMPELERSWGYPFALGLMLLIALGLLLYFRRKGWLGKAN